MTINEMPVGAVLELGIIQPNYHAAGNSLRWIKVDEKNIFMPTTYISRFMFDLEEPTAAVEAHRNSGNNFYPESNIDGLLNADGGDWFEPKHEGDRCYFCISNTRGFLGSFSPEERELLVPRKMKYVTPRGLRRQHGAVMEIERLVSLPSASELCVQNSPDEGEGFSFFRDHQISRCMTRTAAGQASYVVPLARESYKNRRANDSEYIMPVIQLKGDAEVECADDTYFIRDSGEIPQGLLDVLSAVA